MRDSLLARLDTVASLATEKATTSKDPNRAYVGLEHLPSGGPKLLGFAEAGQSISTNNVFREGDVLFGKLRPRLRKSIRAPFAGYCSTDILVLRPTASVDPVFAAFVLQSDPVFGEAIRTEEGTKMPRCSWSTLRKFRVYCPSTPAQQRIAEILTTVDEAVEQTEALIAKTQQIKAGLMQDLFTRGVTANGQLRPPREEAPQLYKESPLGWIPREWTIQALAELCASDITYGIVQAGPHVDGGIPYVRTGDMAGERLIRESLLCTSANIAAAYRRSEIRAGEIVCAIRATVGKVLPVPDELDGANLTQGTARISPGPTIDPMFLLWSMRISRTQAWIATQIKGTTFSEITLGNLRLLPIAVPIGKPEQVLIAERLTSCAERIGEESEGLDKLHRLKLGLMQDLLTGRVPVPLESAPETTEVAAND